MLTSNDYVCIAPDVTLGSDVKLSKFINLYGCLIGDETKIGAFVEIQKNARVGRRCKISSHTFICEGVTIEDHVFVGHGVTFINDTYPRATTAAGELQTAERLEGRADAGEEGRLDRIGGDDPLERHHRRARHRRGRERGDTRRARRRHRGRQPRTTHSDRRPRAGRINESESHRIGRHRPPAGATADHERRAARDQERDEAVFASA